MAKKGPPQGTVNNPKGINQYSKGPSQRAIVGAERVLNKASSNRKAHIEAQKVRPEAKDLWELRASVSADRKNWRDLMNADSKFENYRIQTAYGKTPKNVSPEANAIYKRTKKTKQ